MLLTKTSITLNSASLSRTIKGLNTWIKYKYYLINIYQ